MIKYLKENEVGAIFYYVPLHKAPYWQGKHDKVDLPVTDRVRETWLRLPRYSELSIKEINKSSYKEISSKVIMTKFEVSRVGYN